MGFIVFRNGKIIFVGAQSELALERKNLNLIKEKGDKGEFKANVPLLDGWLEPGDTIRYFIYLTDASNRKSNTVIYEFVFVEQLRI